MATNAGAIVFNNLGKIRKEMRPTASKIVRKTLFDMQGTAQSLSRVDTGAMKNGWQTEMESDVSGALYNAVAHVVHNEYGTVRMAAQPMARPALEQARRPFTEAMKRIVG